MSDQLLKNPMVPVGGRMKRNRRNPGTISHETYQITFFGPNGKETEICTSLSATKKRVEELIADPENHAVGYDEPD